MLYYQLNHKARLAQLVVRLIRNEQVGGSNPLPGSMMAGVDQLVRSSDCDSEGCGFESRLLPHFQPEACAEGRAER